MPAVLTMLGGKLRIHSGQLVLSPEEDEPCCCCDIEGIKLEYWAGLNDGHCCNAAEFKCIVYAEGGDEVDLGTIDLNNGGSCEEKRDTRTISKEQAKDITKDADDCCILYAKLTCNTPPGEDRGWGPGGCHSQLANLKVTQEDKDGNEVVLFEGKAGETPVQINACPNKNGSGDGGGSGSGP